MLQTPQIVILDLEFPIKDHQFRDHADKPVLLLRRRRIVFLEALPRQRLTAREEQEEETATSQTGQDESDAYTPHRPDADSSPPRALSETRGFEG